MTLEELKLYNSAINNDLYEEVLKMCNNDSETALAYLNIAKNIIFKEDIISIIQIRINSEEYNKKCGAGEVKIPKIKQN